jgi:HEPN domain-containing protein
LLFEDEWTAEFNVIVEALEYLTEYYTRASYPFLLRGEVFSPSEILAKDVVKKGVELASETVKVTRNYLVGRSIIRS